MPDISKITINGITYNIKDAVARSGSGSGSGSVLDPVIKSFSLNPSTMIRQKNTSFTVISATVNVVKKTNSIKSIILYRGDTSYELAPDKDISSGGEFQFSINETLTEEDDTSYKVVVKDESGKSVTSTRTYKFVYPYLYGVVDEGVTVDSSVLLGFESFGIIEKSNHSHSYTTKKQRPVIAYPKSYGILTSIVDQNNFTQAWAQSVVEVDGVDYYVYVGGLSTATATYKFNY